MWQYSGLLPIEGTGDTGLCEGCQELTEVWDARCVGCWMMELDLEEGELMCEQWSMMT